MRMIRLLCTYHLKGRLLSWVRSCSLSAFLQLYYFAQPSKVHLKNIWPVILVIGTIGLDFFYLNDFFNMLLAIQELTSSTNIKKDYSEYRCANESMISN